MPLNTLQEKLQQLREQLEATDSLDTDGRQQLQQLVADIENALEASQGDDAVALSARTNDIVLKFETEHPQLTHALNQVASALANLGI